MPGFLKTVILIAVVAWTAAAGAQGFPAKPLRILIGFPAGSTVKAAGIMQAQPTDMSRRVGISVRAQISFAVPLPFRD